MKNTGTFYQIVCDNCGEDSEDANGISWWMDDHVQEIADANGFIDVGEKHYCSGCAKKLGIELDEEE